MMRQAMPEPTIESEPYWEGIREGELRLPQCADCQTLHFYPKPRCPQCGGRRFDWRAVSGEGAVYAHTTVHRPPSAAFADDVPYVVAIVRLTEGPHMMTRIVDADPSEALTGRPVRAVFEPASDGQVLPFFRVTDDV